MLPTWANLGELGGTRKSPELKGELAEMGEGDSCFISDVEAGDSSDSYKAPDEDMHTLTKIRVRPPRAVRQRMPGNANREANRESPSCEDIATNGKSARSFLAF